MDAPQITHQAQRGRSRPSQLFGCLLALCLWVPAASAEGMQLEVLLSGKGAPYRELAESFKRQLSALCHGACNLQTIRISTIEDWQDDRPRDLLITVGNSAAFSAAVRYEGPTLHGLIPSQTWHKLLDGHGSTAMKDSSAVFIDQSISRQLRLLKMAMREDRRRIGVLLGPDSKALRPELERTAGELGLPLLIRTVNRWQEVGPAVQVLTERSDILLAIPDEVVFNLNTLYGILLSSYETRVPVMGYSEALSRAGAMISLYTSLEDMALQLAEHSHHFIENRRLPAAGPSRHFNITINHQVARSLGYQLDDPESLHFEVDTTGGLHAPEAAAK